MAALARILSTPLKTDVRGGMSSVRVAADSFHVATISAGMNDQAEYARLFAAAPDLLEALQGLVRFTDAVRVQVGMGKSQLERLTKAHAAIARATGEPT